MQVEVSDGSFNVFLARAVSEPAPVVVVLQELFGVNSDIRETCEELAARGFIAVAPDLFWREAPGLDLNSWSPADWKIGLDLYNVYDIDRGVRDIAAVVDAARDLQGSNGRVGVMGFCLGGLMSYLTAARTKVDAAVVYYGGNTDKYLGEAGNVAQPMLMHFGAEDEFISSDAQTAIKAAFAGKPNVTINIYPGCSHAFARHTGTHYDASAAAAANARTDAFFEQHLQ